MKMAVFSTAKIVIYIIAALVLLAAAAFVWLKWFANDEIKVAVGQKFPLLMMIDNQPVDEKSYMEYRKNDPDIYGREGGSRFYPLVRFAQDPIMVKKLCLVDFTGDEIYRSFEPQRVQQGGSDYYLLIAYRNDGAADIYYQKGLDTKEQKYNALLNKVFLIEADLSKVDFAVTEKGLELSVAFLDKQNRRIRFSVKENNTDAGKYRIIAPVGDTSKNPESFPVVFLNGFELVQKKGTVISVSIDGAEMKPQTLVPLFNYKKVYMARYSDQVVVEQLNPNYSGDLWPVDVPEGAGEVAYGDNAYVITDNNGHSEIEQVTAAYGDSEVSISFSPALPEVSSLKSGTSIEGRFSIGIDKADGMVGGIYSITSTGGTVNFQMNPQIGWQPMPGKLWMKTYFWNCDIQTEDSSLKVNSGWSRKEKL